MVVLSRGLSISKIWRIEDDIKEGNIVSGVESRKAKAWSYSRNKEIELNSARFKVLPLILFTRANLNPTFTFTTFLTINLIFYYLSLTRSL